MLFLKTLILWPARVAASLQWLGALVARLAVGYVFMLTGMGKLEHLDQVIENFSNWGIPVPHLMAPLVAGWEAAGGLLLMLGLLTRISAGGLAVIMLVAITSVQWSEVDSLHSLLGLEETLYGVIFAWLAIHGAGTASLDHWLTRSFAKR